MNRSTRSSLTLALILTACGGADGDGGTAKGGTDTGSTGLTCASQSDCGDDSACLRVGDESTCHFTCWGSVDACGARGQCGGVASVEIDICQPKKAESAPEEATPEEEVFLPCANDAECAALDPGAVCGTWMGGRDCTVPCSRDSECNPPAIQGISVNFYGCLADEGDSSRTVCLSRLECFDDPTSCISGLPGVPPGEDPMDPFDPGF